MNKSEEKNIKINDWVFSAAGIIIVIIGVAILAFEIFVPKRAGASSGGRYYLAGVACLFISWGARLIIASRKNHPPHSSTPADKAAAVFVAKELERLMSLPLDSKEDAKRWDVECASFQNALETRFPSFKVDHQVWHFFTDSDIRQKDAGYRQRQNQAISDYVTRLRH